MESHDFKINSITSVFDVILETCNCPNNISVKKPEKSQFDSQQQSKDIVKEFFYNASISSASMLAMFPSVEKKKKADKETLFHYFNVRKPVMVTHNQRYQIIYFDLNGEVYTMYCLLKIYFPSETRKLLEKYQISFRKLLQTLFNVTSLIELKTVEMLYMIFEKYRCKIIKRIG